MHIDTELRLIAESQHGLVSRDQALLAGVTPDQLFQRSRSSDWELERPNVLRLVGAPRTSKQRAMAAVLDAGPGALLSHHSALAMWSIPGFRLDPPHIIYPRGGLFRRDTEAILHTSRRLPPHHVTVLEGLPLTMPGRTLFDIAHLIPPGRLERAAETAWARRLITGPHMYDLFDELKVRGRPGLKQIAWYLKPRGRNYIPAASGLELRFHKLIDRDGQPPLERQIDSGGARWVGRVDAGDLLALTIFEINSDRYHSALIDKQADEIRYASFAAAGFAVYSFTEFEVWHNGEYVQKTVRQARDNGRRLHGAQPLSRQAA